MNIGQKVGVVGSGAMGRGIAQLLAQAGHEVLLHDSRAGAVSEAQAAIAAVWQSQVAKGKLTQTQGVDFAARLREVARLEGFATCDVVIEAIVEKLDAKQALFTTLENHVSERCILASNTSSLAITDIARACAKPARVAGLHFFNPVPLMRVVEVIGGVRTDESVCAQLMHLIGTTGHSAVRATDTPGFIINHAGRGFGTEALRCLQERVASVSALDAILRDQAGFRLGPFELMDLTALDVSHPVMESIYNQYFQEPRYRPSPITAQRLSAGLLGRKTNAGFYVYTDGKKQDPEADEQVHKPRKPALPIAVHIAERDPAQRALLESILEDISGVLNVSIDNATIILIAPLGSDVSSIVSEQELDASRTLALDLLIHDAASKRRVVMTNPATTQPTRDAANALFSASLKPFSVIEDSAGFVTQRVLATIINIACDMCQQGVTTPAELDMAVKLGLGYPIGPLAWGDLLQSTRVLATLEGIHACTRDPRYRPSPWLRRRAQLGLSLLHVGS
jgi:3-hydroxybutyryl-CoA dehydrogenase